MKVGRLVLIKSTLALIPICMLSLFMILTSIVDEFERIMRHFLWGSMVENKKFHLISWEKVCIPITWGGLGIKRLKDVNILLLCKGL